MAEVTEQMLADEVGTNVSDDPRLAKCVKLALTLLNRLTEADAADIPDDLFEEAWLATAASEYNRRKSPNGMLNTAFGDASGDNYSVPVRVSKDPLDAARGILSAHLTPVVGGV